MDISSFKEVVKQYKVVFFDAYGVLRRHQGIMDGVKEMLEFLKKEGIDFYIITNDASRAPELMAKVYQEGGIDIIQPDNMISSAMISAEFLKENVHPGSKVAYLGMETSAYFIREADLIPVKIENLEEKDYEELGAVVLFDDSGYEFKDGINKTLNVIRNTDAPVVLANPDLIYPVTDDEFAIAIGSLSNMLENVSNRKFFKFGKPGVRIFEYAFEKVNKKRKVAKREVLMVGDTLDTDIIGGNVFGIDTALVLSGSTLPNQAENMILNKGIVPTHICKSVLD